ncbi:MAG: alpha/beta hydrolase [Rhodothermales bacterium]|nr:alpha/beta hydrolase [Rhodothermales bacterium]
MQQRNSDADLEGDIRRTYAGTPVRVRVSGPLTSGGHSLLLLHGWGSRIEHMWPLAAYFPEDTRIVAVDMPGHGESPPPSEPWGVARHVQLVEELIADLTRGPLVIVGHSNGGRIALTMAASDAPPANLEALVLVAPSGIRRKPTAKVRFKRAVARLLKAPFTLLPGRLGEGGVDWLRHSLVWRMLGSSDYRSLEGVMRATFVQTVNHYVEDVLDRIDMPVLVLRGAADRDVTRDQTDRLVAGLADAGYFEVEGAGHFAQTERPDVVAGAIRKLITAEASPGRAAEASA